MTAVRLFRGEIVEELPDGKVADPFIMALVRHHAENEKDISDLLSFLRTSGFQTRHLAILLERLGRRIPLLASRVDLTTWDGDRMLRCREIAMPKGIRWRDGALSCDHMPLPDSITMSIEGRRLGNIISHPYLPPGLVINEFEQIGARWTVRFRTQDKRDVRRAARRSTHHQGETS